MHYRLPLELELAILELAAPPLAIDSLHDRVEFFINISLVHRSFTAWAQERLCDQFLYTYRPRPDEHKRLKRRFEAGFGRDRPLRRLYLDLTELPTDIDEREEPGTDSVSVTVNWPFYEALPMASVPDGVAGGGTWVEEQGCEAVAHYVLDDLAGYDHWEPCAMITGYSQVLDTLWVKLPYSNLNIKHLPPPRALHISGAYAVNWGSLGLFPISSETVLFLRSIDFLDKGPFDDLDARHLIFADCWWFQASAGNILPRFYQLETLVLFATDSYDLAWLLANLPPTIRRVYLLQQRIRIDEDHRNTSNVLPHLESFTFTWLQPSAESESQTSADADQYALAELQQIVESIVNAPICTFKFLHSTAPPEDALAHALAAFKLHL